MTEQEKMEAGLCMTREAMQKLAEDRAVCKDRCLAYNMTLPSHLEERCELMKKILGKTGGTFHIESDFWCDYGYNITIGEHFYANHNTVILDCAKVTFGSHVLIGPNCGFYTAGHPLDTRRRNQGLEYARPITVGDNVWIGGGVSVMPGVTIGSNTVIGSGSVVTKDIPSGVVAVGNPCRVLHAVTEEDMDQ